MGKTLRWVRLNPFSLTLTLSHYRGRGQSRCGRARLLAKPRLTFSSDH
jgi:hypothetical protein